MTNDLEKKLRDRIILLEITLSSLLACAIMLQEQAEGCAANHYGGDHELFGLPSYLVDTQASIIVAGDVLGSQAPFA